MEKFKELLEAKLKNLDKEAQAVWAEKDLEKKRSKLLTMISKMKGSPAQNKYKLQADAMKLADKMDKLASNLMLSDANKLV